MIHATRQGDAWQVCVQDALTIYQASELHTASLPWLAPACDWHLDLSAVQECDGAGVQWVLYVHHYLHSNGHRLAITQASEAVLELLRLCPGSPLDAALAH